MYIFPTPIVMVDSDKQGFSVAKIPVNGPEDCSIERRAFRKVLPVEDEVTGDITYVPNPHFHTQLLEYVENPDVVQSLVELLG